MMVIEESSLMVGSRFLNKGSRELWGYLVVKYVLLIIDIM